MKTYQQQLESGLKPIWATREQYMVGDYYLLWLTTCISNHHNTPEFKAWCNGVAGIARHKSPRRSLDGDVIQYQFKKAQELSAIPPQPAMGMGMVKREGSSLYALDSEVYDDHPLMEHGYKVILPFTIRYNMAALAGMAIITAWGFRLKEDTLNRIKWEHIAEGRWNASRILHQLTDYSTEYVTPIGVVMKIPNAE